MKDTLQQTIDEYNSQKQVFIKANKLLFDGGFSMPTEFEAIKRRIESNHTHRTIEATKYFNLKKEK